MNGEYGYMEEGQLGKPYNIRLLKRLGRYAAPYKKTIGIALVLTVLITTLDLAIPYITKITIDRFILSSWYRVDWRAAEKNSLADSIIDQSRGIETSNDGFYGLIPNSEVRKIDPSVLRELRQQGIISEQGWYMVDPDASRAVFIGDEVRSIKMPDGSVAIPMEDLKRFERSELLRVRQGDLQGVARLSLILLVLLLVSFGLEYGEYYLLEFTGQNIMQGIRVELFDRIQSQSLTFFNRNPVGRLVTRVTNDVENLNEMFKSVLITIFNDVFLLAGILGVLFYLNWRLALVGFAIIPLIFGLTLLFSFIAREAFRELRQKIAKLNAFLQERISGIRIIQLFVNEEYQGKRFSTINHETYLAGMKQIRVFAVFMPVMELISSVAVALIIWYGGGKVISDQLTLGSLVAFITYIQKFFRPIRDISEKYNIMQSAMASTERIVEFMDHHEEIPEPDRPERPAAKRGHLVFERVSFSYQPNQPVLREISFEVRPGEVVAVVGATGAGKSTIINLIERFYDPDQGRILLDGIDLRNWSKAELRSQIGLVMQDVFLFAGSLKENILLGKDGTGVLENALRQSNAYRFVERLPAGVDMEIGEGGATISAGERQLLSFARALASDPRVLILDEATSSVDPETERLIQDAVNRITRKRTTLVIAHRLSTIHGADRILVLHHGRIREQGTHDELMALGGIYYRLNRLYG